MTKAWPHHFEPKPLGLIALMFAGLKVEVKSPINTSHWLSLKMLSEYRSSIVGNRQPERMAKQRRHRKPVGEAADDARLGTCAEQQNP